MRTSLKIALGLIIMNAFATAMIGAGLTTAAGLDMHPGGTDAVERANESSAKITATQGGVVDTLFTLYTVVTDQFLPALKLMVAGGPVMLSNLGFPNWLTTLIFAPAYLIIAADVVHLLTGRDA